MSKRRIRRIIIRWICSLVLIASFVPYIRKKLQEAREKCHETIVYGRGPVAFVTAVCLHEAGHDVLLVMPQMETVISHYIRGSVESISVPYSLRFFSDPLRIIEPTPNDIKALSETTGLTPEVLQDGFANLLKRCKPLQSATSADRYVSDVITFCQPNACEDGVCFSGSSSVASVKGEPSNQEIRTYHLNLFDRFHLPVTKFRQGFLTSFDSTESEVTVHLNNGKILICSKLLMCDEFFSRFSNYSQPSPYWGRYGYTMSETFPSKPFSKVILLNNTILLDLYHDGTQMTLSISELAPYLDIGRKGSEITFDINASMNSGIQKRLEEILACFGSIQDLGLSLSPICNWKYGPLPTTNQGRCLEKESSGASLNLDRRSNYSERVVTIGTTRLGPSWDPLRDLLVIGFLMPTLLDLVPADRFGRPKCDQRLTLRS